MAMTFKTDLMPAAAGGPYNLGSSNTNEQWMLNGMEIPYHEPSTAVFLSACGTWEASIPDSIIKIYKAVCSTSGDQNVKEVTIPELEGKEFTNDTIIAVTYDYDNTSTATLQLKVNSTTAVGMACMYNNGLTNFPKDYLKNTEIYYYHYRSGSNGKAWVCDNLNLDTNSKMRVYGSVTDKELPLIGVNSGTNIANYTTIANDSYSDLYSAIPGTADNVATINPSTGKITAPGGIKISKIEVPVSSGSTTYGLGSDGQVLTTNGSDVYWKTPVTSLLPAGSTTQPIYIDSTGVPTTLGKSLECNVAFQKIASNAGSTTGMWATLGGMEDVGETATFKVVKYSSNIKPDWILDSFSNTLFIEQRDVHSFISFDRRNKGFVVGSSIGSKDNDNDNPAWYMKIQGSGNSGTATYDLTQLGKVKQTNISNNNEYKVLITSSSDPNSGSVYEAAYDSNIKINPSSDTLITPNLSTTGLTVNAQNNSEEGGEILLCKPYDSTTYTWESHIDNWCNKLRFWGLNTATTTALAGVYVDLPNAVLYGACWNDYAEYRKDNLEEKTIQEPGRCVRETGDGTLTLTTERLERGCEIISDTFGFAIGQDQENGYNTPIASNGRVLAYVYEGQEAAREHIGWPVCSGPEGTVSIMTEEEEMKYPSRIIGTISEIPDYEFWGTGKVEVKDRVWIRVR